MSGVLGATIGSYVKKPPVSIVASNFRTGAGSMSVPSHQDGDMIVFMNSSNNSTAPSLTTDFTNITTRTANFSSTVRSFRLQYLISDGTLASLSVNVNGIVFILRNATTIIQFATVGGNQSASTNIPVPTLSNALSTNGRGLLLAGTYTGGTTTGTGSSSSLARYGTSPNSGAFLANITSSTYTPGTITQTAAVHLSWIIEVS